MDSVKVYYDRKGSTLTVWFADPGTEHICEETGNEVILIKDVEGRVIGIEKLHFSAPPNEEVRIEYAAIGD